MLKLFKNWVAFISIFSLWFVTYFPPGISGTEGAQARHHFLRFGKIEYPTHDKSILPRPRVLYTKDIVWFKLDMTRVTAEEARLSNDDIKELKCFFSDFAVNQDCQLTNQLMNSVDLYAVNPGQPDGVSLLLRCDSPKVNGDKKNAFDCSTYPWWLASWVEVETGDASHPYAWQLAIGHKREGYPPRWRLPDPLKCPVDVRWKENPHCPQPA